MQRRDFVAGVAASFLGSRAPAAARQPGWKTWRVVTDVHLGDDPGPARLWVPRPLPVDTPYQRTLETRLATTATRHRVETHARYRMAIQCAEWDAGTAPRRLTLTATVATRDRRGATAGVPAASPEELERYRQPTRLIPITGIVRETADAITRGATSDDDRARRIYDWIVEHTFRDPAVAGCGLGDIRWMLETRNLGGKCADLNALFVGLARAAGLPARDLYGLRVAPSATFRSLGKSGDVTASQHCRAEVYLRGRGWWPVDPADVRKVVLEERPGAPLDLGDPLVVRARADGFGTWEMNWLAYNDAHDVALPGSGGAPLPFLMYPQAEVGGRRLDSLNAETFRYELTAAALP